MARFHVGGRMNAATAATANHVAAQFWNPHASARPRIAEIHIVVTVATAVNIAIQRSSARGATPGLTVTPDIDSNNDRDFAPVSTSVLELAAFTTQPTLETPALERWNLPASVGAGVILPFPRGIVVPFGTGLCVATPTAAAFPVCDITFVWDE